MNGENRPLLTNEPVEFEEEPAEEVQDLRKITDNFQRICGVYLKFIKEKPEDHNM
jgi:hypothetical protein